jgi:hypothetical protein
MSVAPPFAVTIDEDQELVQAWSEERLSFEPKGWLLELRIELRAALQRLKSGNDSMLSALYGSPLRGFCDPENALIYNVGASHLSAAAAGGLRIERAYASPTPPDPVADDWGHYWCYRPSTVDQGFWA